MAHGLSPEELDALTEEERAGLEEESEDDTAAEEETAEASDESTEQEDAEGNEQPEDEPKSQDDVPEGEESAEEPKAGLDEEEPEPEPQPVQRPKPLIDAQLPDDFDEQVKAIQKEKRDLRTKFADGELDEDEFYDKLDELEDKRLDLRIMKERAELSRETTQQQVVNDFQTEVSRFLSDHPEIRDDEDRYDMVDAYLRKITSDPENWNKMTPKQMIDKAYERYQKVTGGAQQGEDAPKPKKQAKKPDAPKTLANVPAAEVEETDNSKFSQLTRLLNSSDPNDVVRGEEILGKMSEAEQNRYLAIME